MRTYIRLLGYLKPYRARLAAALACTFVYASMNAISLGLIAPFMKVLFERAEPAATATAAAPVTPRAPEVQAGGSASGALAALPGAVAVTSPGGGRLSGWPGPLRRLAERWFLDTSPQVALERICVFILIVFLIKNLADYLQAYHMAAVEQSAIRDLRSGLQSHLQTLPLGFFNSRRTGVLVSRMTNDVEYLRASLAAGVSNLAKDSLTLIGCLIWVFVASWKLALISLLVLPPVALALVTIGRKMRKRSAQAQERMGDLTSLLHETIVGARIVRAFSTERWETERFAAANRRYYDAFVRLRRVAAAARPMSDYAIVLVAVAMLWFAGREIFVSGGMEPQQFVLFVTALLATISPIKSLSEINTNIQQGVAAAERIFSILDTPPTIRDREGARALPRLREAIRYENVSFAYEPGQPVLEEVSFEVRAGEVVALVGSSGAGKSTALDLLARFHDPTSGAITIDGVDLRDVTLASLRGQLGIVTQETLLFHETVRNNIAYGLPDADPAAVREAAEAAHAHDWIMRLPQGYDTVIGERGTKLSGGERQRLAIARALLRNPPILMLDEATSALDLESERLVRAALERLMRGRTTLVIAHRLSTVQHADRIVVLERGRVVASGSHARLLEADGLYRRLYDLQFVA